MNPIISAQTLPDGMGRELGPAAHRSAGRNNHEMVIGYEWSIGGRRFVL
jgi:hypothetical protein